MYVKKKQIGFGSLMDIDKLIRKVPHSRYKRRFGSLMDIDKLIHPCPCATEPYCFGSLMDIDKLIPTALLS